MNTQIPDISGLGAAGRSQDPMGENVCDRSIPGDHPLRQASWIWPDYCEGLQNTYADFRRDFDLEEVPDELRFWITADQQYMLYVNGRYVGRGPARGYQLCWPVDCYDLASCLGPGHNWIAIRAYNAGISTYQYVHQRTAGLLCASDPELEHLRSDGAWLCRRSRAARRDVARLSKQMNFQEHIDATVEDQDWIHACSAPTDWHAARVTGAFGSMPWHDVSLRGIGHLTTGKLAYRTAVASAEGDNSRESSAPYNLVDAFRTEWPGLRWTQPPAIKVTDDQALFELPGPGKGRFTAVTLDLGRPGVGTVCLSTESQGDGVIDLHGCEVLHDDGSPVVPARDKACWASMAMRLRFGPGQTCHEFFQIIGHRYLTVVLRDVAHPVKLGLSLRETRYPLEVEGQFLCGDPTLNDIHRICVQTQRVCMLDAYVDTPWREQAQWWGDARVQAANTFHLANDARLLARGIESIGLQDVPNGLTYGHAPTSAHHCILPDFTLTWLLTFWDHYYQTANTQLFEHLLRRIDRALDYFETEAPRIEGLLAHDRRYWLFLDWADLHKKPVPTAYNLLYVVTLAKLAMLARAAGNRTHHQRFVSLMDRQVAALQAVWNPQAELFSDGLDDAGERVKRCSVATQTLALLADVRRDAHQSMIDRRLCPYLAGQPLDSAKPSSFWVHHVYQVMVDKGFGRAVIEHIRRHWSPMIRLEGTTEQFVDGALTVGGQAVASADASGKLGEMSCTHAWSAHPICHLAATVGGIRQSAPGWRQVVFQPVFDLTNHAELIIPAPPGPIRSAWRRDEQAGQVDVELSLPDSVEATVRLPGESETVITGKQRWQIRTR